MLVIPMMVIISLQTGNHLWSYLALGLAVLSALMDSTPGRKKQQNTPNRSHYN